MNTDVFFTIGSTHKICQDYAITKHDDKPLILLSDGCSSSPNSDFGSRLLVKAAEPHVYHPALQTDESFLQNTIINAHTFSRTLELNVDCLCATLLYGKIQKVGEKECFKTICSGDGTIAARSHDGSIVVHQYEFDSGAPYYLRYELDPDLKKNYFSQFGKTGKHKTFYIDKNGKASDVFEIPWTFCEDNIYFENSFPVEDWDMVAIFSDGVCSFTKPDHTSTTKRYTIMPVTEILPEFLSFKGFAGDFVQRRCQKVFKTFKEQGIQNCDDFSMAVIAKE